MAFSSGTFSLYSPGNPVVTGTTISSSWANNTLSDIATGLSTCVLKDGTQTMTANLPMSSFRITGLGAATARTDAVRASQVQDSTLIYVANVTGTNTVTGSCTPAITAYVTGQIFNLVPAGSNTGATTLNVNSVGSGAVQNKGAALVGGELVQNSAVSVAVVTTTPVFEILNGVSAATETQMEAESSTSLFVSPGRQHYHDGHPKAVAIVSAFASVSPNVTTLYSSLGVITAALTTTGDATVTWANSLTNPSVQIGNESDSTTGPRITAIRPGGLGATSVRIITYTDGATAATPNALHLVIYGTL